MILLSDQFSFGLEGSARPYLGQGWSLLETEFTWTEGHQSRICLPVADGAGTLVLEISLAPLIVPPILRRQRLIVTVGGMRIAEDTVGTDGPLGYIIPAAAIGGGMLDLVLECPDAVPPSDLANSGDTRTLGFAVKEIMLFRMAERPAFAARGRPALPRIPGGLAEAVLGLTGLAVPDLAGCFESLGFNCEFGLAQRGMGCETLGLLRFGGISLPKLAEGLDLEFDGIEAPENLTTYINDLDGEIMVRDRRYGTIFHSHMYTSSTTAEAVLAVFTRSLGFLRRKFMEDVRGGGKIFVFQHPEARSVSHVRPFLNLLRSHGPNSLLFVTESTAQAGAVEMLEPDLLHGWIPALAPVYEVTRADVASWIEICANAYRLWRETEMLRDRAAP